MAKKIRWTNEDTRAVLGVGRCGHFTKDNLRDVGLSDRRIKTFSTGQEHKYFEKIGRDCNTGQELYKLSELGKEKCEELGLERSLQYRCQGREETMNFEHDRKLADVYCSLKEEEQDRWKTEEMYKEELEEKREWIRENEPERWEEIKDEPYSAFDGGYVDEQGQEHYVEVATDSYRAEDYASKETAVSICGNGSYQLYHA